MPLPLCARRCLRRRAWPRRLCRRQPQYSASVSPLPGTGKSTSAISKGSTDRRRWPGLRSSRSACEWIRWRTRIARFIGGLQERDSDHVRNLFSILARRQGAIARRKAGAGDRLAGPWAGPIAVRFLQRFYDALGRKGRRCALGGAGWSRLPHTRSAPCSEMTVSGPTGAIAARHSTSELSALRSWLTSPSCFSHWHALPP